MSRSKLYKLNNQRMKDYNELNKESNDDDFALNFQDVIERRKFPKKNHKYSRDKRETVKKVVTMNAYRGRYTLYGLGVKPLQKLLLILIYLNFQPP